MASRADEDPTEGEVPEGIAPITVAGIRFALPANTPRGGRLGPVLVCDTPPPRAAGKKKQTACA